MTGMISLGYELCLVTLQGSCFHSIRDKHSTGSPSNSTLRFSPLGLSLFLVPVHNRPLPCKSITQKVVNLPRATPPQRSNPISL